ncbi:MAG: galactose-1-phosphate uridylyltransferase [Candidatus Brocadiaceae bacterium]|nr:galactose-1-phosphate uridylyltransferase [Candidatus Brocadiaceae bacterium]
MPELRKDPVSGRWVIIATERAMRPNDFISNPHPIKKGGGFCPFCEGNEEKTPPEIMAYRDKDTKADTKGWRTRVVPNKFPVLRVEGDLNKRGEGVYDSMNGIGAHEVIIENPKHIVSLTELENKQVEEVLSTYRDRLVDLKKDERFIYGLLFKNVGAIAGASLEHSHSQLIVTPIVPISVMQEMNACEEFYKYRGRCLFCDIVRQEIKEGTRIVLEDDTFVVFTPYASHFPFEIWVLPKAHSSQFENLQDREISELARVLRTTLLKLEIVLEFPAYNYVIHTTPFVYDEIEQYHWHIEIIPRLTKIAGFEWGSGFYINTMTPENAAEYLRNADRELK